MQGLNEAIRADRKGRGELAGERVYQTTEGARAFAPGDRLLFRENNRDLGVKNGMLGTVERAEDDRLTVRLDSARGPSGHGRSAEGHPAEGHPAEGRVVSVSMADYAAVDHGYATTIHKAQGATVDRAYVLASGTMDRHLTYVAMTRHRDGVQLYAGQDEFHGIEALSARLSRSQAKETTLDYEQAREAQARPVEAGYAERRGIAPSSEIVVPDVARAASRVGGRERELAKPEPSQVRPAQAMRDMDDSLRAKVRAAQTRREAAEKEPVAERPERKRGASTSGMFDGLKLGTGRGGREDHAPAPIAADAPPRKQDTLNRAVDRYARAWTDVWRMQEQDLPVLEHQKAALRNTGTALDGAKPGALRDLSAALRYDPAVYDAMTQMQGPTRTTLLVASLAHEDRVRREPELKAERLVKMWNGLEAQHKELRGWEHEQARGTVENQMKVLAGELKRDPQVEAFMLSRKQELGIADGSRLDRVLHERDIERAIDKSVVRSRGLGLSR